MNRLTSKEPLTEWETMNLSVTNLYARLKEYEDAEEQGEAVNDIDVAAILYKAADAIRYMERISALHDCNDCARKQDCQMCPRCGEQTRINCFFWTEDKSEKITGVKDFIEKGRED